MPIKKGNLPGEPKLHINSMVSNFYHGIIMIKRNEYEFLESMQMELCLNSFIHIEDTLKRSEIT